MLWKYKKCYQETSEDVVDPIPTLFQGLVSDSTLVDPTNTCDLLTLDSVVYIDQQNTGFITAGDIVYIDNLATSPFAGNSEYYKLKATNSNIYIITIDPFGVVANFYALCA